VIQRNALENPGSLANASLLLEATAAAEAMARCFGIARQQHRGFFAAGDGHRRRPAARERRKKPGDGPLLVKTTSELASPGALTRYSCHRFDCGVP
jgi:glycine cleavage system pyridoxal-binding protein P